MTAQAKFSIGALGGTFDHFHNGHEHFLKFAAEKAERVLIGVTNQSLIREKELSSIIQPYEVRSEVVRSFCEAHGIQFEIVELTDMYGPTLGQREVDCLIVTELTERGGEALNKERGARGLQPLETFVCSMLKDETGQILNSTRIRQGKVNREGKVYAQVLQETLTLTEDQKNELKEPLGDLVQEPGKTYLSIVVGDETLETFLNEGWPFQIGVFDLKKQRVAVEQSPLKELPELIHISNPAGSITAESSAALLSLFSTHHKLSFSTPRYIQVDGEEDLLVLPAILLAPLNSMIYYGQPNVGIVQVLVDEKLKEKIYTLLLK